MIMNQFLQLSFLLLIFNQIAFCDQQYPEKMQLAKFDFDVKIQDNKYCHEGFLQGTLVKTIDGYLPIEQLAVGDVLAGIQGNQKIVSIKKYPIIQCVQLLIGVESVSVAAHQQFYLSDMTLCNACDLQVGSCLSNGSYVSAIDIFDQSCNCYSLSTQDQSFFVYPNLYVHNSDLVTLGTAGVFILGAIEISNPVTILLGIIIPLSVYAMNHFKHNIVLNYEFDDADSNLTAHNLCLQNVEVIQKTRTYYEIKKRALCNLYQDLVKIKNEVSLFAKPNYVNNFNFSFGFLFTIKPIAYNLSSFPDLSHEMQLSFADKEKLMKIREEELVKLQQNIFDIHLALAFHINEIIDRRDQTKQNLLDVIEEINEWVDSVNDNAFHSYDIVLAHYQAHFIGKELLDDLKIKIHEVAYIITYYEKLKNHFFVSKSTNLLHVFPVQAKINKDNLNMIEAFKSIWWSNMCITEDYLRERNLLTHQLVQQYTNKAKQYIADQEKNTIVLAQNKNDEVKKQVQEIEDQDKKGGGGGPEDPEDPDDDPEDPENKFKKVFGYFKNVFTHAFTGEKGHFTDSSAHRKLVLDMASDLKNFIIKDVHGNYWYAKILENGKQVWAWARDGLIRDCGINDIPRAINKYGLCNDILIK